MVNKYGIRNCALVQALLPGLGDVVAHASIQCAVHPNINTKDPLSLLVPVIVDLLCDVVPCNTIMTEERDHRNEVWYTYGSHRHPAL